jgi:hypothetical protein
MTRSSIIVATIFALSLLTVGNNSAVAKPITDREKACQYCYDRCGKWEFICRIHCRTRSGCPAPNVTTDRR